LSFRDAVIIGLSQALAVFPGVSRSGSTITAGLALGMEREAAARFSFLLSAPIVAGAGANSLIKIIKGIRTGVIVQSDIILFPVGFIAAALSGFLCIKFLLRFLQKNKVNVFVYYRWTLAALVFIVVFLRFK
jgi:undecaprenyl-diphosphatase